MKGPKKGGHKELIEGRELIGDRQVEFTRHFDERGETFTQYGSGAELSVSLPAGWPLVDEL